MPGSENLIDAAGRRHRVCDGVPRIVSLVPSITELVCELGLAGNLVGRTGFCVHPKGVVRGVPKVGGTKTVDLDKIRELAPTHVIVNVDENTRETAAALDALVPNLIVTHPLAPMDNVALFRLLGAVFRCGAQAEALVAQFDAAHGRAVAARFPPSRRNVLYLIWREPWMTVSRDTYISRALALVGLDTVPESTSERYPKIELESAAEHAEIVLLSTEPYRFRAKHVAELRSLPSLAGKPVELVDGELTSWYGSRAIAGMDYIAALRHRLELGMQAN